jgi:hypothetical protein
MDPRVRERAVEIYTSLLRGQADWVQETGLLVAPGAWSKLRTEEDIEGLGLSLLLAWPDGPQFGTHQARQFRTTEVAQVVGSEVFKAELSKFTQASVRPPIEVEELFYSMIGGFFTYPEVIVEGADGKLVMGGVDNGPFWIDFVDETYPEIIFFKNEAEIFRFSKELTGEDQDG